MGREHTGNKYLRTVHPRDGGEPVQVDVYNVLDAFGITCPAVAHAVKKLLCAGLRGKGDALKDLQESIDAISRAIELLPQRETGSRGATENPPERNTGDEKVERFCEVCGVSSLHTNLAFCPGSPDSRFHQWVEVKKADGRVKLHPTHWFDGGRCKRCGYWATEGPAVLRCNGVNALHPSHEWQWFQHGGGLCYLCNCAHNSVKALTPCVPKAETCCNCGEDYPRIDLVRDGQIYCAKCRFTEMHKSHQWTDTKQPLEACKRCNCNQLSTASYRPCGRP